MFRAPVRAIRRLVGFKDLKFIMPRKQKRWIRVKKMADFLCQELKVVNGRYDFAAVPAYDELFFRLSYRLAAVERSQVIFLCQLYSFFRDTGLFALLAVDAYVLMVSQRPKLFLFVIYIFNGSRGADFYTGKAADAVILIELGLSPETVRNDRLLQGEL